MYFNYAEKKENFDRRKFVATLMSVLVRQLVNKESLPVVIFSDNTYFVQWKTVSAHEIPEYIQDPYC